jgi:hypothetical protein
MSNLGRIDRPGQGSLGNTLIPILIVVIGVSGVGYFLVRHFDQSRFTAPFQPVLPEYLAMRPEDKEPSGGVCKGGIITINVASKQIDDLYFDLPDAFKARDPESVKTVVFLSWRKEEAGLYDNGRLAYKYFCMVEMVDRETKELLQRGTFGGLAPPNRLKRLESGEGTKPTVQVIAFLKDNTQK